MTHSEKVKCLIEDLRKRGVGAYTVAPPAYRLLWRLGWEVRPPLFQGFFTLLLQMGVFFGVFWGVFMWVFVWQSADLSPQSAVTGAAEAGVLFGLAMASYYRWKARSLRLPDWDRYPNP